MKLHLPKQLFTALLAAISFLSPAALTLGSAAWGVTGYHSEQGAYLLGGTDGDDTVDFTEINASGDPTTVTTIDSTNKTSFKVWADDSDGVANVEISNWIVADGTSVTIGRNYWHDDYYFADLHIECLNINQGNGSASLTIETLTNHDVRIDSVNGSLSKVSNVGTLTLGTEGSTINLSGTVTNTGTMTVNGTIVINSIDQFTRTSDGTTVWSDTENAQGFRTSTGATYLLSSGGVTYAGYDSGSMTISDLDGAQYSVTITDGNATFVGGTVVSTIYEVNKGSVSYDGTEGDTAAATGFLLGNGTTLKLTGTNTEGLGTGKVTIDAGDAGDEGEATYSIANGATQTYASLGLDSLIKVKSGAYVLNIDGENTVVTADQTGAAAGFHTAGEISITNGGTLELKNQDALGWSTPTPAINIENATLKVGARQTVATSINMIGGATITATASPTGTNTSNNANGGDIPMLHAWGYTLAASGLNNVIDSSVGIGIEKNFTINVDGDSSSLAIKGAFYTRESQTDVTITKSGSGTLILDGVAKTIDQNIDVTGGTLQIGSEESTSNLVTLVRGVDQSDGSTLNIIGKAKLTGTSTLRTVNVASTGELTFGGTDTLHSTITNEGSIIIDKGTNAVALNSLLGGSVGTYKNISNTGDGYITVTGSGTKSLNGDITLNTGGKIVLTGGSFGTEASAISHSIASGTNKTVLEFKDIDAYIGGAVSLDMTVNDGATVNLKGGVTVSGAVTLAGGKLNKIGDGILNLNGALSATGASAEGSHIDITDGTVQLGSAAQSTDIRFNVTENGRLVFGGTQTGIMTHQVSGSGTAKVTFGTGNHNNSINFGETFEGTVEVSGHFNVMDEYSFNLAKNATLKLVQGQVWSNTATVLSQNIELDQKEGETTKESFIGSGSLTLNGAVTGDYLETSGTLVLTNANNDVKELKVTGGTTTINNGTYGTITLSGGTTTINDGTYGTITLSGGTTKLNGGNFTSITVSQNLTDGKLQFGGGVTHTVNTSIACNALKLSVGLDAGTVVEFWGQSNSFKELDLSEANAAKGTIYFRATQEAASATAVATNIWMKQNDTSILIDKNASLTWKGATVKGGDTAEHATIKNTGGAAAVTYQTTGLNIKDAELIINNIIEDTTAGRTIGAKLESTALTNGTTSELTVNNAANTITKLTAEAGNVTLNETMRVDDISAKQDKVVSIAAGKTLNMGEGSKVQLSGTDSTAAASMTAKTDSAMARLQADASFTIQDMTLTNTKITAATTTEVKLKNVDAENLALAQGKFTMEAIPAVGDGGTAVNFDTGVSSLAAGSASLTLNLDMIGAYASIGAVNGVALTITLGVSGENLGSYDVDAWKALVGFDQESWLGGQALVDAKFTTEAVALAETGEAAPTVSYGYAAGDGGSNVGTLTIIITGLNVPEPATSTLSLLALAALAARRRRK